MEKTFRSFENRKDRSLVGFSADDNAALLRAICSNSATAYVRQMSAGGAVSVPKHAAEKVREHLVNLGWTAA